MYRLSYNPSLGARGAPQVASARGSQLGGSSCGEEEVSPAGCASIASGGGGSATRELTGGVWVTDSTSNKEATEIVEPIAILPTCTTLLKASSSPVSPPRRVHDRRCASFSASCSASGSSARKRREDDERDHHRHR